MILQALVINNEAILGEITQHSLREPKELRKSNRSYLEVKGLSKQLGLAHLDLSTLLPLVLTAPHFHRGNFYWHFAWLNTSNLFHPVGCWS